MFTSYQQEKKACILSALTTFIAKQKQQDASGNQWRLDVLERLSTYIQGGKMIRGTLVYLGYEAQTTHKSDDVTKVALAVEILSSGILIHDDIIDNSDMRRGKPSIHASYTDLMAKQQSRYPKNTGKSLALCVGDTAYFLAYQLLSELSDPTTAIRLIKLCSNEYKLLTYAQMQDITLGATNKPVKDIEEIFTLYKDKTARYSVLFPLTAGAMLGNATSQTIKHIAKFSENIGIAYQLVDDKLDLFGTEKETGKPVGTDIREGKQTPFIYFLRQVGDNNIHNHLVELFSKGAITQEDITWVQQAIKTHHIDEKITSMISRYERVAKETIIRVPMEKKYQDLFLSFVEYLTHRIQ
ncbi:MAG: polyprenyl synthetase family protein [Candidatus Gottesmanbacteria bacterium]